PGTGTNLADATSPALTKGPWVRHTVVPGLELHVARGFSPPQTEEEEKALLKQMRQLTSAIVQRRRGMKA
ncbi:MAG: hypothetical protein AAF226_18640, partial [Verrucomicrobiota bacterium]